MTNEIDDNLLKIFAVEAGENLDSFEDALMKMESDGLNAAVIQEAFRLIHNIKGSAAMVGLTGISKLAHAMEDRLDQIRNGKQDLSPSLINLLFQGVGRLHELLNSFDSGDDPDVSTQIETFVTALRGESPHQVMRAPELSPKPPEKANPAGEEQVFAWDRNDIIHIEVEMKEDVVFKDVKAYLVKSNLLEVGTVVRICPPLDTEEAAENTRFNFLILSTAEPAAIEEKVKQAAEIKNVTIVPVTSENLKTVKNIYELGADDGQNPGAFALRRWGDQTLSVIIYRISERTHVIKFSGEMDGDAVVTLMDIFQENPSLMGNLIADFSKLNYINSLGLGFLIRLYKNVLEKGGQVQILGPSANIRKLLDNTKISSLIPVIDKVTGGVTDRNVR